MCRTRFIFVLLLISFFLGLSATMGAVPCTDVCTEVTDQFICGTNTTVTFVSKIDCYACKWGKKTCVGPKQGNGCVAISEMVHTEGRNFPNNDLCTACGFAGVTVVNGFIPSGPVIFEDDINIRKCWNPT